jgi:hypothetical protein
VTDAPSRQDSPENEDGRPSDENAAAPGTAQTGQQTQDPPQWAADQPAPAPWYLGRPGAVPPPPAPLWPQGPGGQPLPPAPPLPPPTPDQAAWPQQAPGTRPEAPSAGETAPDAGAEEPSDAAPPSEPAQDAPVPPWTGQAPPNPEQPAPGQQPPAPWLDPNRYGQPGARRQREQQNPNQRSPYGPQQPRRGEEPGQRPPLSLPTRWARGLAIGGALCTLITLRYGYQDFPAWLIGAAVALVMSLSGLWLGVFAQREAARRSQRAPEAVSAVVWSALTTLVAVAVVAISLAFYPQLRDYSHCMRTANTIAGQSACQKQLDDSLTFRP